MKRYQSFKVKWTVMNDPNLVFCPTPDCEHYFNKTTISDEKLPSNDLKDEEIKSNFKCPQCL